MLAIMDSDGRALRAGWRVERGPTVLHRGKASAEQLATYKASVLAFIAERGPVPRSDIWQSLHGRVTVGHVDQCLEALLKEDRIKATKAELGKPVEGPWKPGRALTCRVLTYTATVYSVVRHDE